MDAQEYDRIADLLMQIRKKYAKLGKKVNKHTINIELEDITVLETIDILLQLNDNLAKFDAKGWL